MELNKFLHWSYMTICSVNYRIVTILSPYYSLSKFTNIDPFFGGEREINLLFTSNSVNNRYILLPYCHRNIVSMLLPFVTLLLTCCYNVVTILLPYCYIVAILLSVSK